MRRLLLLLFLLVFFNHAWADDKALLCPEAGYGFFRLPDSSLCLAPRGFVRSEMIRGIRLPPHQSPLHATFGTIAKAQLGLDFVSTQSDWPEGGRVRIALARETGWPTIWSDGIGTARTLLEIDEAWLRIGAFMAGRGPSRFDFYRDAFNYTPLPISDFTSNFFAFRMPLTDWLYAEIAIEDGYERLNGLVPVRPRSFQKPDVVGVLRAASPWPVPAEFHLSATIPKSENGLFAWQAGAAFDMGGDRPHLLIVQIGMSRGPPSYIGLDRGMMQAITGADILFRDETALRGYSAIAVYRRPIWNEHWTMSQFLGVGQIMPVHAINAWMDGPAALMMGGSNIEWRSKQGLMIGLEAAYVVTQSPAVPYTRFGEGLVWRLRIERGF